MKSFMWMSGKYSRTAGVWSHNLLRIGGLQGPTWQ